MTLRRSLPVVAPALLAWAARAAGSALGHAAPPLAEMLRNVTRIAEDTYDWTLNDATPS